MNLRRQLLLLIAAIMCAAAALVVAGLSIIIMRSFKHVEVSWVESDLRSVRHVYERELEALDTIVRDWAWWDDSCAFLATTSDVFIASSLNYETIEQLGVDFVGYFHENGEMVWAVGADRTAKKLKPLPAALVDELAPGRALLNMPDPEGGVRGLLTLPEGPLMVVVRRVLRSDRSEPPPPRGIIIIGRFLSDELVAEWGRILSLDLRMIKSADEGWNSCPCATYARPPRSMGEHDYVWFARGAVLTGCVRLRDVYGRPAICLYMEKPRPIYYHARAMLAKFVATLIVIVGLTLVVLFFALHRWVVQPMELMTAEIESIAQSCDVNRRVGQPAKAELAALAQTVNHLLSSIGDAEAQIRRTAERIEKLNRCFLGFGPDANKNIESLVHLAGEILESDCALYNRMKGGMLCTLADWQAPPDLTRRDAPEGHLCYDVVAHGQGQVLVVRNLQQSRYADTDPNVRKYGLQTYIGYPVFLRGQAIGSLCCVYTRDVEPSEDERRLVGILAASIAVEEMRLEAEQRVWESREGWKRTFDLMPDPVCIIDANHVIQQVNAAMLRALNLPKEKVVGSTCFECVHHTNAPIPECPHAKAVKSGETCTVEIFEQQMGGPFYVTCAPICNEEGQISGTVHVARGLREIRAKEQKIRDLLAESDRARRALLSILEDARRTDEALRQSEARYRDLVAMLPESIFETNATGRITYANETAFQQFGYTEADIERGLTLGDLVVPEQHTMLEENVRKRISGMGGVSVYSMRRRDGSVFLAGVNVTPIFRQGQFVGLRGIAVDLTEHQKIEELRIAKEAAERVSRAKSEFLAVMSHELRTPLHTIMGFAKAMEEGVYGPVAAEHREVVRHIAEAAEHLMQLISDILDMTRIEIGRVELMLAEVSLKPLLTECVELIRGRDDAAELTVELKLAPELEAAHIRADPRRLRQILLNLLSNSVKFNLPGGRITVEAAHEPGNPKYIRFAVKDTGVGVDPLELERIFERFHRGTPPDGKWRDGAGLGLSLAQELVELHGGRMWAEAGDNGCGLKVYFVLPVDGPAALLSTYVEQKTDEAKPG